MPDDTDMTPAEFRDRLDRSEPVHVVTSRREYEQARPAGSYLTVGSPGTEPAVGATLTRTISPLRSSFLTSAPCRSA